MIRAASIGALIHHFGLKRSRFGARWNLGFRSGTRGTEITFVLISRVGRSSMTSMIGSTASDHSPKQTALPPGRVLKTSCVIGLYSVFAGTKVFGGASSGSLKL